MADGKDVVTYPSIPVSESPAEQQVETPDVQVNEQAEAPSELDFSEDVVPSDLDWPELQKVEEVQQETVDQVSEDLKYGNQPEDTSLTDGMKNRISKIKQKEAEKLAGKDEEIRLRDEQIRKLQEMTSQYANLQSQFRPVSGNVEEIEAEIKKLDDELEEEGDVMTPAEIHRIGRRQNQLENQLKDVRQQAVAAENVGKQQQLMRQQSDEFVQTNYPFVKDRESEYYKTLQAQAYPMLEQLVPNFKDHPHDMVLAAELSKMMVNAQKYEQMLGNSPAPRPEPQPMAETATPAGQPQAQRSSPKNLVANARGKDTDAWAGVLNRLGHNWNPEQNMR